MAILTNDQATSILLSAHKKYLSADHYLNAADGLVLKTLISGSFESGQSAESVLDTNAVNLVYQAAVINPS